MNYVRFQGFSPAAECSSGGRTDHELVLPTCVLGAKLSLPQLQTLSILLTSKELVLCCLQMAPLRAPFLWFNFSNLWAEHVNNSAKHCFQHLWVREMRSRSRFLLLKCEMSASSPNHSKIHRQILLCMLHCINSDLHLAAFCQSSQPIHPLSPYRCDLGIKNQSPLLEYQLADVLCRDSNADCEPTDCSALFF